VTTPERVETADAPRAVPAPQSPPTPAPVAPSNTQVTAVTPSTPNQGTTPNQSTGGVAPDVAAPSPNPASGNGGSVAAKEDCSNLKATLKRDYSVDPRSRKQRIVDCVGGWFKGEVDEFRGGVDKSVDTVGRGLEWLGNKLRRRE
jgi:hypothetical protein